MKKVPNVTLHRGALANASKIMRENLIELGLAGNELPTLVLHPRAVSNFFVEFNRISITGGANIPNGVYISEINRALQNVNLFFAAQTPGVPRAVFVSAATLIGNADTTVEVFLDIEPAATVTAEWVVSIDGIEQALLGVSAGTPANSVWITVGAPGTITVGQVLLVSHIGNISGITNFIDQPVTNNNVAPLTDMDGDGLPDTQFAGKQADGAASVTEDADSVNIDITGDDKADIVIPK